MKSNDKRTFRLMLMTCRWEYVNIADEDYQRYTFLLNVSVVF